MVLGGRATKVQVLHTGGRGLCLCRSTICSDDMEYCGAQILTLCQAHLPRLCSWASAAAVSGAVICHLSQPCVPKAGMRSDFPFHLLHVVGREGNLLRGVREELDSKEKRGEMPEERVTIQRSKQGHKRTMCLHLNGRQVQSRGWFDLAKPLAGLHENYQIYGPLKSIFD